MNVRHFLSCEDKYTIERAKSQEVFAKCVAFAERFYTLVRDVHRTRRNTRPINHFYLQVVSFDCFSTISLRAAVLRLRDNSVEETNRVETLPINLFFTIVHFGSQHLKKRQESFIILFVFV